jgi:PAS domain S-box-containing protein
MDAEAIQSRHNEEALRRSEAHLIEAQRIGHVGSWAVNPASGEMYGSPELWRIFGFNPDTTKAGAETQRLAYERVHTEDRERVRQAFDKALRQASEFDQEYRLVMPDGAVKHVHGVARPMRKDSGEIELIGTIQDLTERKRSEGELREVREELARVARALVLGELAASIAHEINQPLAALATNADAALRWLNAAKPNIAEANESLRRISRDANRAAEVIAGIRAFLARSAPQKRELSLDEVMRAAEPLVGGEAQAKGVALVFATAPALPPVLADRIQVQQVIVNLALNALEAMIGITAHSKVLRIAVERYRRDELRVSVRDTGAGLQPEHAEKIFDAFFTTKPGGLGMGLAISRSIVEAHGGRLWATPNAGPGATFHFTLPIESR